MPVDFDDAGYSEDEFEDDAPEISGHEAKLPEAGMSILQSEVSTMAGTKTGSSFWQNTSQTQNSWMTKSSQSVQSKPRIIQSSEMMGYAYFYPTDPRVLNWNRAHHKVPENKCQSGMRNYFGRTQSEKQLFEYLAGTPRCKPLLQKMQKAPAAPDPKKAPHVVGTLPTRYDPMRLDKETPFWNNRWQVTNPQSSKERSAKYAQQFIGRNSLRAGTVPPEMLRTLYEFF